MRVPGFRRGRRVRVTLFSKAGCSLCQDAERTVRRVFGTRNVDVVDIIGNKRLEDEYIFRIPVLVIHGNAVAEGRITLEDARTARATMESLIISSEQH